MKKEIRIDKRALREIKKFPARVQARIDAYLKILGRDGRLEAPIGKKITSTLFEVRIKYQGQWPVIYAYIVSSTIIVLSAFHKKTQKTPQSELQKAQLRLKDFNI